MRQSIKTLIEDLKEAKQALEDEIIAEMSVMAYREYLDSFSMVLENQYIRDGEEVGSQELDALDSVYCENINENGVILFWEKDKGFV
jgi:hypothetical protein